MGISGLMTFIRNHSDRYMEHYQLHDTYLVIDGNSLGCQIYCTRGNRNCAFGGDYDKYAADVSQFFDDLLKCGVTPLVLLDGGIEKKKMQTLLKRIKDRISSSLAYGTLSQRTMPFLPLFRSLVFTRVMIEKGIRFAKCLFEADNAIALLAKLLDCPVLSFDSDFYIYGSLYIPFNTLENRVSRCSTGSGYAIRCQIYRTKNLLRSFAGLEECMLPLAAALLGNDYVQRGTFQNFFSQMKLHTGGRQKTSNQQCRITATLDWLSRYSLNEAIIGILSRLRKDKRKKILEIIEENINAYANAPIDVFMQLGLSEKHILGGYNYASRKPFKFDGDIYNLTYIHDDEVDDEEEEDVIIEAEVVRNMSVDVPNIGALPQWFIDEFKTDRIPTYFLDLLIHGLYICPVSIEDQQSPSCVLASVNIISVIYGLLISGLHGKKKSMTYMIREDNRLVSRKCKGKDHLAHLKFPLLATLRDVPLLTCRAILNSTLGIQDDQAIEELPPEWTLYIACIKYWIEQTQQQLFSPQLYVYSLMFSVLLDIVNRRVGRFRSVDAFEKHYERLLPKILASRKAENYKPVELPEDMLSMQPYDAAVDKNDCLLAAPFFLFHRQLDQKVYSHPKKYNKNVIHAFSEFQQCLFHVLSLNDLLGRPYMQTNVHRLYNGTFLYNLFHNFKTRNNVQQYICTVLQNSPTLLKLFTTLMDKVKRMCPSVQWNMKEKKKTRAKRKKARSDNEVEVREVECPAIDSQDFHDPNNSFTLLHTG